MNIKILGWLAIGVIVLGNAMTLVNDPGNMDWFIKSMMQDTSLRFVQ
jgi:hypothetical protein